MPILAIPEKRNGPSKLQRSEVGLIKNSPSLTETSLHAKAFARERLLSGKIGRGEEARNISTDGSGKRGKCSSLKSDMNSMNSMPPREPWLYVMIASYRIPLSNIGMNCKTTSSSFNTVKRAPEPPLRQELHGSRNALSNMGTKMSSASRASVEQGRPRALKSHRRTKNIACVLGPMRRSSSWAGPPRGPRG